MEVCRLGSEPSLEERISPMNGTYQTRFDFAEQSPVHAVVNTIAAADDTDPADLPPLNNVVDPDALDTLLTSPERRSIDGSVTFTYCGYGITVRSNGTVSVDGDAESTAGESD